MFCNFRVMNINMKAVLFVSQVSFDNYVPEGVVQSCSTKTTPKLCQSLLWIKLLKRLQHICFG